MLPRTVLAPALALALALIGLHACESGTPIAEGEPCVFCAGSGGFYDDCVIADIGSCASGLTCLHGSTNTCERLRTTGDLCHDVIPCEDGLICDIELMCAPPGTYGTRCDHSDQCGGELWCNFGAQPDMLTVGQCTTRSEGEGGPCTWAMSPSRDDTFFGYAGAVEVHGCAEGLSCVPGDRAAFDGLAVSPVVGACGVDEACGRPGICRASPQLARGTGCLDDGACASGLCVMTPVPYPPTGGGPAWDCEDSAGCFVGAWPGQCAGAGELPPGEFCAFENAIQTPPCAPGLACRSGSGCIAHWSLNDRERCDFVTEGWPDDPDAGTPICRPGRECIDDRCAEP